ncbi:MAG: zinc ABC transporter substrate-binding protein [Saprospiraceae bacterium]|nr:zinc ABC transporter substrate-binding protein [Saprospiraceae bacterium]
MLKKSKPISLIFSAFIALHPLVADDIRVVATASMIADMAKEIGGDLIKVQCVVPIGGDPHIYDPTPGDAQMVAQANLILRNGLTFEGWLTELIENSGTKAKNILVTEGVVAIKSLIYENATDPHAWMDASNGLIYIRNIKDALIKLDPANSTTYQSRYEAYAKRLEELDQYIFQRIKTIPESKRILITSHDAFQYYGKRYGIRLESVLGTSTDAEVQTADIVRLNRVIKESGIPALFVESTINPKVLEQIASDNHLQIGGKLYSDSIGNKDSPAPSYYDMLKHNTDVIVAALSAPKLYIPQQKTTSPYTTIIYILIGLTMVISLIVLTVKFNR